MIDCHVITLPTTDQTWLAECLASIDHPQVKVHVVDGTEGNIGAGRSAGLSQGNQDFVTWIDPDDWAEPGAFDTMIANMGSNGITTDEYLVMGDSKVARGGNTGQVFVRPLHMAHHFVVLRRELINPYIRVLPRHPQFPEPFLYQVLSKSVEIPFIDTPLYNWRQHSGQSHNRIL